MGLPVVKERGRQFSLLAVHLHRARAVVRVPLFVWFWYVGFGISTRGVEPQRTWPCARVQERVRVWCTQKRGSVGGQWHARKHKARTLFPVKHEHSVPAEFRDGCDPMCVWQVGVGGATTL